MFGHTSDPSLIFRYGALPPVEDGPVLEQMRAAHRYRNKLVEIERDRREKAAAIVSAASPDLAGLERQYAELGEQVESAAAEIKATNQRARKQRATLEQRAKLRTLRAERAEVYARLKEAKHTAYHSLAARAALDQLDAVTLDATKAARATCSVYWGTYLQIEAGLGSIRKGPPPRFLRWTGDGKLAVQIQGGMSRQEAEVGDSRLKIATLERRGKATNVYLRIGTDEMRNPIWAIVPVIFHRPIPDDAQIKWVYLLARRVGTHTRWAVCFVLSRATGWGKPDLATDGAVGLDLGWRILDHGLRVAYWCGSDGAGEEIVLPLRDVSRWQKADDLRAIRGKNFDAARDELALWLAGRDLPDWLIEQTRALRQWRNATWLAALAIHWREDRFTGDEEAFAPLEAWRTQDKHLLEWEANQRRKAVAWRDDFYRRVAADLSRRYKTLVIEDCNWREMGRLPEVGESNESGRAGSYRVIAAVGSLARVLRERFAETVSADPAYTTQRCHVCGQLAQAETRTSVWVKCNHCGEAWDQDRNAALNLLSAASGAVT